MHKIVFGIPILWKDKHFKENKSAEKDELSPFIDDLTINPEQDEIPWCDFALEYDFEKNYYYFSVETAVGFDTETGSIDTIRFYFDCFTKFMEKNHLDTSKELDMYEVFTEGININTHFNSEEDAYAFMKFAVRGFRGKGLYDDKLRQS